jgi:hypothetical protein
LRQVDWFEARRRVERSCIDLILRWRGEDNTDDDDELEEILQEVIVIDDEDAEHEEADEQIDDSSSVDFVTSMKLATDVDHAEASPPYHDALETQSDQPIESERLAEKEYTDGQAKIQQKWREAKAQRKTTRNMDSLVIDLTEEPTRSRFIRIGNDYFGLQAIEHASLANHQHYEIAQMDRTAFKSAHGNKFLEATASKPASSAQLDRTAFKSADGSRFFEATASKPSTRPRAPPTGARNNRVAPQANSVRFTSLVDHPSSPGTQATKFFDITGENTSKPQPTSSRNHRNKTTGDSIEARAAKTASFVSVQSNDQTSPVKFYDVDESAQPWDSDRLGFRSFNEAAKYQAEHDQGNAEAEPFTVKSSASGSGKRKRTAQRRVVADNLNPSPQRKKRRTGDRHVAQETDVEVHFESRPQRNTTGISAGSGEELGMIDDFVRSARIVEGHGGPAFTMID